MYSKIPMVQPKSFLDAFNEVGTVANALTKGQLDNAMQKMQNQYYPKVTEAEIASKNAYAQNILPQLLGNVLASPAFYATATKDQVKELQDRYINSLNSQHGYGGGQNNLPVNTFTANQGSPNSAPNDYNPPNNNDKQNLQLDNNQLLRLRQKYHENSMVPASATAGADQGGNAFNNQAPPVQQPQPNQVQPNQLGPATNYASNAQSTNPIYNMEVQKSGMNEMAKENAKTWSERLKENGTTSQASVNTLAQLDKYNEAYKKLSKYEKGPILGSQHALTDAAQQADQASENMMTARLRALQQGHITDADFKIGARLKPGRYLGQKANETAVNFNKGVELRNLEKLRFDNYMSKVGITPGDSDQLWAKYIEAKPFFNAKTNQINTKNINSWSHFITPQMIRDVQEGVPEEVPMEEEHQKWVYNLTTHKLEEM